MVFDHMHFCKLDHCLMGRRYGIWGDWENPYLTLDPKYEAAQLRVFSQMLLKGHIYRGRKPVHWSPSSQTALAESELEYPEGHVSPSIYVALPIEQLGDSVPSELREACSGAALAIWTTTPWTMPANAAVAVNEKLQYSLVEVQVTCILTVAGASPSIAAKRLPMLLLLSMRSIYHTPAEPQANCTAAIQAVACQRCCCYQ